MFGFAKKGGGDKKNQPAPVPDAKLKYEKTLHDLRSRRDQIQDNIDRIDSKVTALDQEIRSLLSQGKKQQARNKVTEMKSLQKQIEQMQTKYNVLTQMTIQIETLEQDQGIADVVFNAAELGKMQQETNDKLQDAMMDWNEFETSQQETSELWKQMSNMGVDNEQIDAEFEKYMQENDQQQAINLQKQLNTVPANQIPAQQQSYQQQNKNNMEKELAALLE
ncbi:unnamed protein product [Paramecium pentaurelia]|uniref:Uncharacterized protein n=1 Tax=Paramecium pentaurelia TaxID=43138 RepID=A0A8S1UBL4_9CILI|nr:unnamed protein product [Paramecium pentaurelia]